MEGYTYHLTHRCHGRAFLLGHRRDRNAYREWLRHGVGRFNVPVYAYCITRNHVHVVAHARTREAVSKLMHLASGSVAKGFNVRMERIDSMWEHPYHCTIIEDGQHLLNCLRYIDLNMVRAGEVAHPRDWPTCGYRELTGQRKRYRFLDVEGLVERAGAGSVERFHRWYAESIEQQLASGEQKREGYWSESLAVGGREFVDKVTAKYRGRRRFSTDRSPDGTWHVREDRAPYGTQMD